MNSGTGTEVLFHRRESPTQTAADAAQQVASGEIWGKPPRFGNPNIPCVQAYRGPLPEGTRGIEFTTKVAPDEGTAPHEARWTGTRPGVDVKADFARIRVHITQNTQAENL